MFTDQVPVNASVAPEAFSYVTVVAVCPVIVKVPLFPPVVAPAIVISFPTISAVNNPAESVNVIVLPDKLKESPTPFTFPKVDKLVKLSLV